MSTLVVGVPSEIKDNENRVAMTPDGVVELETWFRRSRGPAGAEMDARRSAGALDPSAPLYAFDLSGDFPNRDLWVG